MATDSKPSGSSKGKVVDAKVKRIEILTKQSLTDSKNKSVSISAKTEVKSKSTTSSSKTIKTSTPSKPRAKKVFSLTGQKFDPPEEREPLRIFYESLSKQIPSSEMAEFWMMEHGLLSPDKAKKAHEKKQRNQKAQRMGTPIKSAKPPSKPESSQRQQQASRNGDLKAKKRITNDSDDDDDFILRFKRRKGVVTQPLSRWIQGKKQSNFQHKTSLEINFIQVPSASANLTKHKNRGWGLGVGQMHISASRD